jgi:hypothetical protein
MAAFVRAPLVWRNGRRRAWPSDSPLSVPASLTPCVWLPPVYNGTLIPGLPVQAVKYYLVNGQRIASRVGSTGAVTYYYHDHLGSTVASSGGESTCYWPYGATRSGNIGTAYRFTGQRQDVAGLYFQGTWARGRGGRTANDTAWTASVHSPRNASAASIRPMRMAG